MNRRTTIQLPILLTASIALVLSGCAMAMPGTAPSPVTPATTAASAPAAPVTSASPLPSATPSTSTTPTPTTTTPAPPAEPPKPAISAAQRKKFGSCLTKTLRYWARGGCVTLAQKELKKLGYLTGPVTSSMGVAAINGVLNYQRSRGLAADGQLGKNTWTALALKTKAIPDVMPKACYGKGVVLCVDQAHRKLRWLKNGKVVKTFRVRVGGFNVGAKTKEWRVFPTANGTWKVYNKLVDPPSENYGPGAMPYSTMFYPDMYVHYSPDFHARGYARSSHGCVNIGRLADAIWIFKNTPIGAKVITYGLVLPARR